jgi:tripartite-type tricarboxylate transporter receptor subunit TctC
LKFVLTIATALAFAASASLAQTFPSKPIRWVVPSSAGGGNDQLARLFGAKITQNWGQQVIVDLRPGAAGIVGSEIVAKAPPDGYTILIVATGYSLNPSLYATLPYDTLNDFARVTLLAYSPNVLVVHPSLPVKSVKQLIALAKSRPGDLNYASSGAGTGGHLSIELLKHMVGIQMVHVPYKGAGDSTAAVVSGQVHMLMTAPGAAIPFIKSGRLRPIAVGSGARVKALPDVPTVAEAGLPGYAVEGYCSRRARPRVRSSKGCTAKWPVSANCRTSMRRWKPAALIRSRSDPISSRISSKKNCRNGRRCSRPPASKSINRITKRFVIPQHH